MIVGVFPAGFEVCVSIYCLNFLAPLDEPTGYSDMTHQLGCDQIISLAVRFKIQPNVHESYNGKSNDGHECSNAIQKPVE